jgi:hypothetical protein
LPAAEVALLKNTATGKSTVGPERKLVVWWTASAVNSLKS